MRQIAYQQIKSLKRRKEHNPLLKIVYDNEIKKVLEYEKGSKRKNKK